MRPREVEQFFVLVRCLGLMESLGESYPDLCSRNMMIGVLCVGVLAIDSISLQNTPHA